MYKLIAFAFAVVISVAGFSQEMTVLTFNIRYNNPGDSLNSWPYRKDHVAETILFTDAAIVGVQEALAGQMSDLQQRLSKYKPLGGGREDGKEKGEYSAIFFDTTRLQLLESKMFWLSETPEGVGSKGWDAALSRVVTWAKFRDKRSKKIFFAFNTHFDHMGKVARRESAHLLLNKIKTIAGNTPVVCTGDFNAEPSDEPIQVIKDEKDPLHLTDAKILSKTAHFGPGGTFNAFQMKERGVNPIDYIFLKGNWDVLKHATLSMAWQGRYASDHFPVMAIVKLK